MRMLSEKQITYQGTATALLFARSCPGTAFENADFLVTAAQRKRPVLSGCSAGFLSPELGILVGREETLASVSACSLRGGIQLPQILSAVSLSCHSPHQAAFSRMQCRETGMHGDAHLALACQKAQQPFGVSAPFLYITNGMFKDNRCGVKVLSWENPMSHSIEGLL